MNKAKVLPLNGGNLNPGKMSIPTSLIPTLPVTLCPGCQGNVFEAAIQIHELSPINPHNTTGQTQYIPVQVIVCRACGKVLR